MQRGAEIRQQGGIDTDMGLFASVRQESGLRGGKRFALEGGLSEMAQKGVDGCGIEGPVADEAA